MNSWVIISNKAVTNIYSTSNSSDKLELVETFKNDKARLKQRELESDSHGSTFNSSTGRGGRQFSKSKNTHDHFVELYAHQITSYVKKADVNNQFNALILTAGPEMMGVLLKEFQKKNITVNKKIGKEYSNLHENELSRVIRNDVVEAIHFSP